MKKTRIVLICLLVLLCMVMLCSCDRGAGKTTTTTTKPQTSSRPDSTTDKWDQVDVGGVIKLQLSSLNDAELEAGGKKYMQGPDAPSSDKVQNLVYQRNLEAKDILGLDEVQYYYINAGWGNITAVISDTEKNGSDKPDMYCDIIYDMVRCVIDGCFYNLKLLTTDYTRTDGTIGGYFDFEAEGYLADFMEGMTLSSDKMYLLGSEYFIDIIRGMMVMPVNIDMYHSKVGDIDQFYQDIIDGKWTWDYLMNVSKMVYNDKTNNGNSMDDILGLACETGGGKAASGMVYSTDISIVKTEKRNGLYSFTYSSENKTLYDIFQKIAQVFKSEGIATCEEGNVSDQVAEIRQVFAEGRMVFGGCVLMGAVEAETYQSMEQQFGLVPLPKLAEFTDKKDADGNLIPYEYNTLIHNVGRCGAISLSTPVPHAISAFIQYCSENSSAVINEYYNFAMKYKYTSDAGTAEMLDLIYDNIVSVREKALDDLIGAYNSDANSLKWHSLLLGKKGGFYTENASQIDTVYSSAIKVKQTVIGQILAKWDALQ